MNILCVITARGGSKGIPGKNIKDLGGKPLIAYSIEQAKKSKLITHSIVSTDDKEIAEVSKKHGGEVPFMRPSELAEDDTPHLPVMRHAVSFMEEKLGIIFDYIVIFQPTSPFRTVEDIDCTIQKLVDTKANSAVSVCEVETKYHPMKMKKLEGDKVLPYFIPESSTLRQELPKAYKRSSAVYAMDRTHLMEGESLYGDHIVGHIVPANRSIDIDVPFDWTLAEYMLEELKKEGLSF
jgi:N-acylneuraminate cytidylyltransferase/CMP-N,N'-diacetyllegionaminic acid synthase|tara:strand:+ start:43347 stop:44057 length:711 start_codon:yes stop_codon:yes gene_type:complete